MRSAAGVGRIHPHRSPTPELALADFAQDRRGATCMVPTGETLSQTVGIAAFLDNQVKAECAGGIQDGILLSLEVENCHTRGAAAMNIRPSQ